MKGMELSRLYYDEVIRPFLRENVQEYVDRIAVGLVGEGSECLGFDDAISRDHDWGANICLWLDDDDYGKIGEMLQRQLLQLPGEFHGYPVNWIPGRNGVMAISAFFKKYLNKGGKLLTVGEWLIVPESYLATAANGEVFCDPLGRFSEVWNDLRLGYPEDIRLKKLAARCMTAGQAGQYNFPRLLRRKERVAAELAKTEFIRAVISIVYLLNNRYTPFYKWMHHGMKELPIMGTEMASRIEQLLQVRNPLADIEEICRILVREFHRQHISEINDNFLISQGNEIHRHIKDDMLRSMNPWAEAGGQYEKK